MMRRIQGMLLLVIISLGTLVLAEDVSEEALGKLMALSGLNKQVAELPAMFQTGFEKAMQQGVPLPDALSKELKRSMEGLIDPAEILRYVANEIANTMTQEESIALLAWYESDLGRKITLAEEKASTPAAYEAMLRGAEAYLADKKRVKLAEDIEALLNTTEMTIQIQEYSALSIYTAVASVKNHAEAVNIEAVRAQISAQAEQIRSNIEQLTILSFVYAYKDLEIAEIEEYYQFLEEQSTILFNESVKKGMSDGLNMSIDTIAHSMASVFDKDDGNLGQ